MSGMLGAWTFSWSSNSTSVGEPRPEATAWRASHVTGRPIAVAGSPPHLRGKPPRCGHRAPRCRRWSYAWRRIGKGTSPCNTTFAYHSFMILLGYPVHAEICFSSSVKRNAPNAIECSWMQFMNYELQYFVLCLPFAAKSIPLRAHSRCPIRMPWRICPLITAQTTSWAWILNTWIMVLNIRFSMKTMRFFIFSEWFRAFAEVPLFKSPNVIKCLFDRSNHDSTCHILSSHTHTHNMIYHIVYRIVS